MKTFLFLLIIISLLANCSFLKQQKVPVCSAEEMANTQDFWRVDATEAYEFGVQIQQAVKAQSFEQLFSLVEGELGRGPRRKYVQNKQFSEVFPESWRRDVLSSTPPCSGSWRGFSLGNGKIWFWHERDSQKWNVFAINGWVEEEYQQKDLPKVWLVNDEVVRPQCLVMEWLSGDNFEEHARQFSIKNLSDFRENTGKYLGKEVSSNENRISIVRYLDKCLSFPVQVTDQGVKSMDCESCPETEHRAYTMLARVSNKQCQQMAPHLPGKCEEAYLIEVGDYTALGTMGNYLGYNVYGLFVLENQKKVIVPLKNFLKKSDSLNYIDSLQSDP